MKGLTSTFFITFTLVGLSPARVVAFEADAIPGSTGNEAKAGGTRYEYAGGWGRSEPPEMVDYLMDLDVGPGGNVYLLHVGGDRDVYVQVLTPAGKRVRIFGGYEHGLGGGSSQGAIAVGPDGSIYVVGFVAEAVTKFVPGRKFPQVWKWFGPHTYFRFDGVTVGRDGRVYVVDWGDTIECFTAEGKRLEPCSVERPPGSKGPGPVKAIAVGPEGRLFMAVEDECYVPFFNADATPAGEITWEESVMGPAVDVAVAPDGAVYVTDGRSVCTLAKDGLVVGAWVVDEEWDPYRRRVRGLAAGRGKAVCVGVDNVVKFFTRKGRLVREIDATVPPPYFIHYPRGIVVSPDGVVYVGDNYEDRLTFYTAEGERLGCWGMETIPATDHIYDVAWCPDGALAVLFGKKSESMRAHVAFYRPNGELVREWPVAAEGVRRRAFELAVAPDGTLYLGTNGDAPRVLHFASDGGYLGSWYVEVEPSISDGGYVADLTVGYDGTVYVVLSDYYGLLVYSADGKLREERYVEELGEEYGAQAVAVGFEGNVFLASKSYIYRFNADGEVVERWGGTWTEPGRLSDISAMAVTADGTLYVVDSDLKRVQYFRPVGREE